MIAMRNLRPAGIVPSNATAKIVVTMAVTAFVVTALMVKFARREFVTRARVVQMCMTA